MTDTHIDVGTQDPMARLKGVEHIVVLMKENRSFDQMLGYLMRDGLPEVRGLRGDEANYADGVKYDSFEWDRDQTVFHPEIDPSGKILDPCHSKRVRRGAAGKRQWGLRLRLPEDPQDRRQTGNPPSGAAESSDGLLHRPPPARSMTTWRAISASATPGTPRSRVTPGPTASLPWPAVRAKRSATSAVPGARSSPGFRACPR